MTGKQYNISLWAPQITWRSAMDCLGWLIANYEKIFKKKKSCCILQLQSCSVHKSNNSFYLDQENTQSIMLSQLFQSVMDVVWVEVMVTEAEEQGTSSCSHDIVWNNVPILPWYAPDELQQWVSPLHTYTSTKNAYIFYHIFNRNTKLKHRGFS